jgi:anthranilate synthase
MDQIDTIHNYVTAGRIEIERTEAILPVIGCLDSTIKALDSQLGVLLTSRYEYPGRYSRWDIGFVNPPLQLISKDQSFSIAALNDRGIVLLPILLEHIRSCEEIAAVRAMGATIEGSLRGDNNHFNEENRSKQPSIFSIIRVFVKLFYCPDECYLGLYGAFGYDLAFQFEKIKYQIPRHDDKRDLVLYLPDDLMVVDHHKQLATRYKYEFRIDDQTTKYIPRAGRSVSYKGRHSVDKPRDHAPGEFAKLVRVAHVWFKRGDLFEVVPSQSFYYPCPDSPSRVFRRLCEVNPAPYGTFMNLGEDEYLVGASPEMFLRSHGRRIETCPISGTIARGRDAIGDAEQILKLLSSEKERSELTMCTDVDRNDKARVCEPGSIRLIGRRLIEMYSRLIHTVDHVEGTLREGYDALDAFLSHTWAVTVTGAPKLWAMRFIEQHERSHRAWYGGAIGLIGFNGNINTGLTLRTIRIKGGIAEVRAGATLLIDADPESEERETELKASALIAAIEGPAQKPERSYESQMCGGKGKKILLIDHEDSFVNILADYFRQCGGEVMTVRWSPSTELLSSRISSYQPDLIVLSPGPGTPADFKLSTTIDIALQWNVPIFGVCLGLQGIAERFGGKLAVLPHPMHGKPSRIRVLGGSIFEGLPQTFVAGRYHSLYAIKDKIPADLTATAMAEDDIVMAIEHKYLPLAAVQFHPESIMSAEERVGLRLIDNVARLLSSERNVNSLVEKRASC